MPNQIELKDAEQDQEIALLKHRVQQLEGGGDSDMVDELRVRVRKLEKLFGVQVLLLQQQLLY